MSNRGPSAYQPNALPLGQTGSQFRQIKPELMYPHKAHQKISVSGLTVEGLLHWLENIPKRRDVQLLVVHVGVDTCWVNTVTESTWRALLKLANADVQISSIGRFRRGC